MKNYLFDDIIYNHRFFFNTQENRNSKFLYDVCFGLQPAKFDTSDYDKLVLDEEDEVTNMYFIQEGIVGIGYYLMTQGLSSKYYHLEIKEGQNKCICDYYVCFNKKSEFIYMAIEDVKAITLSKEFLVDYIFQKYPLIAYKIKEGSQYRYFKNIRKVLMQVRQQHIQKINKESPYK